MRRGHAPPKIRLCPPSVGGGARSSPCFAI